MTATAILFRFCWAIPLRYQTFDYQHFYEGLFYVALALAAFGAALSFARRILGERLGEPIGGGLALAAAAAVVAAPVFALSVFQVGQLDRNPGEAEREKTAFDDACAMTADLPPYPIAAIRTGQYVPSGERLREVFITPPLGADALAVYEDAYREIIASGEPAARGDFNIYLNGDILAYLKEPCAEDDARGRFFLSVYPADERDLPADMRERGHESLNFTFAPPVGAFFNGKIEMGQWIPGGDRLWDAEIVRLGLVAACSRLA